MSPVVFGSFAVIDAAVVAQMAYAAQQLQRRRTETEDESDSDSE